MALSYFCTQDGEAVGMGSSIDEAFQDWKTVTDRNDDEGMDEWKNCVFYKAEEIRVRPREEFSLVEDNAPRKKY